MSFQVAYIPIGVGTYHLESAQDQFEKSINLLSSLSNALIFPDKMLLTVDDLAAYLDTLDPDLIILQNLTFANGAYASEVLKRFSCPVLLWTLREPVIDGTRLRLNSLTGAYAAANAIRAFRGGEKFTYVFGGAGEEGVKAEILAAIRAAEVKTALRELKMASIGHTPQGFGFGRALDAEMMKHFGVTLESVEARELIEKAGGYSDEDCAAELEQVRKATVGLDAIPEKNVKDFARLLKAYRSYVRGERIGAISSRCWPDFFTSYGTPVCAVLSLLNDENVCASCEADTYGALSMYIGQRLTGRAVFFGDPVSMDEKEGTITYWHCGMAACSLARKDTGAQIGVHPNRKIGPVMDFGCRAEAAVTIFRIGRTPQGHFRFFIAEGEALDKPKQFNGTSVVVKTRTPASEVVSESIEEGWEPHFVVIFGAAAPELRKLADMLGMEICEPGAFARGSLSSPAGAPEKLTKP